MKNNDLSSNTVMVGSNATKPDILTLNIYNQNLVTENIDVFSENKKKHTDVINLNEDEEVSLKSKYLSLIRICGVDFMKLMFKSFNINGRKQMYYNFFSLNQFQSNIIDVPVEEELNKIEFEVPSKNDFMCTFFSYHERQKMSASLDFNHQKTNSYSFSNIDKQLCVIAQNKTSSPITIDLLDKKYMNGFNDSNISIEVPINDISENENLPCEMIRLFSENWSQLRMDIFLNELDIKPSSHVSIVQFQGIGVDIKTNTKIKFGNKFKTTLLPNAKIMYLFK